MLQGRVAFVLHAHLPYIRHPENESFLEERWLFEAITETYIPLIEAFGSLIAESIDFRVTMSLTPPLLYMLTDPLLQERYIGHVEKLIELCGKEMIRTEEQKEFNVLACEYRRRFEKSLKIFREDYGCNIVKAFRDLQDTGKLEIIACPATHGFLPLLDIVPESVRAQIRLGVEACEAFFGRKPRGLWLPECGYKPSLEPALREAGIEYVIIESHGVLFAAPRPIYGTYSPIVSPDGLVVFGRDIETSKQVWSSHEGYPGDFDYREFYRDIGHDLDYDYIKDYISPDGHRIDTGIKYYRITGKTSEKKPYHLEWARNKAEIHAGNFMFNRERQIENLLSRMDRPPIIVCPYDAELFGHWWYEGPDWLYMLFKKIHSDQRVFKLTTLSEYMDENPVMQVASPCTSTWGVRGYNEVWLNPSNDWIYRHIHKASERMCELAKRHVSADGLLLHALNQAARELLLAQSSDWAFIMRTGTMVEYAQKRTKDHISRFTRLYHDICEDSVDEEWLREIEFRDNIFPNINYRLFA